MIKNIVFDFGNVIGKFDPDYICGFYCDKENLETFKDIIFDKWADLDAGYIEYDDFKNEKIDRDLGTVLKIPSLSFYIVAILYHNFYLK